MAASEAEASACRHAEDAGSSGSNGIVRNRKHFPLFDELPDEYSLSDSYYTLGARGVYKPTCHWCFIGEITDDYMAANSFFRNRVLVRDMSGKDNIPVAFYPEDGFFNFQQLRKGHTLCVRYAESHHFLDSTVGLREEHLSFAMVLPTDIETLKQISDYEPMLKVTRCWECGYRSVKLKKCAKCKVGRYCSKKCQVAHWETHRKWCKTLPYYKELVSIDYSRWSGEFIPFKSP